MRTQDIAEPSQAREREGQEDPSRAGPLTVTDHMVLNTGVAMRIPSRVSSSRKLLPGRGLRRPSPLVSTTPRRPPTHLGLNSPLKNRPEVRWQIGTTLLRKQSGALLARATQNLSPSDPVISLVGVSLETSLGRSAKPAARWR